LNALQEFLELFSDDEGQSAGGCSQETEDSGDLCLCLSEAAISGKDSAMYMRMLGHIQGVEIVILSDFGSSHTFISSKITASLTGLSVLHDTLPVQVANEAKLSCSQQLKMHHGKFRACPFLRI
jgi:hypothetical protein